MSRAEAEELDRLDPLSGWRQRFQQPDDGAIYLDGNSLGMRPEGALQRVAQVMEEQWGNRLIRSWSERWLDYPRAVGDLIAGPLLGARRGEVLVADSVSVNLYKLICAALDARPGRRRVVSEAGIFPTDRYILQGIAESRGLDLCFLPDRLPGAITAGDVANAVDSKTALVLLSHVDYRSAAVTQMAAVNAAARSAGALTLWDLCHSVGVLPIQLVGSGADLAVGCGYKYLNAGPGAPGFLYVRHGLQQSLRQPIWGWFGQSEQFSMEDRYQPRPDINRFQVGTPNILGICLVELGASMVIEAGLPAIWEKARGLTEFAARVHRRRLGEIGFELASPVDPKARGAHLSLRRQDAELLCRELSQRGVLVDYRPPDLVRLGMSPLTTRYVDVLEAIERLRQAAEAAAGQR